jgi:YfiH family protein
MKINMQNIFIESSLLKSIGVKHGFFTRNGGRSSDKFHSLNCKLNCSDEIENVKHNLAIAAKCLNADLENLTLLRQVHSNKLIKANYTINKTEGDAIYTSKKGSVIGVITADCVPILVWDNENKIAIAIHAGWRGALGGIIENAINEIKKIGKCQLYAAIGPCIRQNNYEVDEIFYELFLEETNLNQKYFKDSANNNKFLFDLPGYCYEKLIKSGVHRIDNLGIDTYSEESKFFSCRRALHKEEKHFGCQLSIIKI